MKTRANDFREKLDTVFCIQQEANEGKGEDSYFCACNKSSAIVSVCDGSGGLGFKQYSTLSGKTGAYIASRLTSGAIRDWYHHNEGKEWNQPKDVVDTLKNYIDQAFSVNAKYVSETNNIRGSMVRPFPTTMAMAMAQYVEGELTLHVVWAGDSRVYMFDQNGLAQLTKDDTDSEDAMENLYCDEVLTNVISSDGKYKLHYKKLMIDHPMAIFAATDGCFGYISSPMKFESMLLEEAGKAKNVVQLKERWHRAMSAMAGDDIAFGYMSFLLGDFEQTKALFANCQKRLEAYKNILPSDMQGLLQGWEKYKPNYERYLMEN